MRKTLFGQCTYSFFDDQFCRQFGIGRELGSGGGVAIGRAHVLHPSTDLPEDAAAARINGAVGAGTHIEQVIRATGKVAGDRALEVPDGVIVFIAAEAPAFAANGLAGFHRTVKSAAFVLVVIAFRGAEVATIEATIVDHRLRLELANHGIDGLVQCFGIESPGLTASLAIAQHIYEISA